MSDADRDHLYRLFDSALLRGTASSTVADRWTVVERLGPGHVRVFTSYPDGYLYVQYRQNPAVTGGWERLVETAQRQAHGRVGAAWASC